MNCKKMGEFLTSSFLNGWDFLRRLALSVCVVLKTGFIQGYTALLNPHYLDASLLVFVEITLNRGAPDVFEQFNAAVQKLEEIQECHLVSGDFDYLLKTRVPDMSAYRKLLGETLLRLPGVNDTRTYVVMEEVKQSNRLVIKTR